MQNDKDTEYQWISVDVALPKENETVWICNNKTRYVNIGCLVYDEGWLWAVTNGTMYVEDDKIVAECELDDDYDVTHWMPMPYLPPKPIIKIDGKVQGQSKD